MSKDHQAQDFPGAPAPGEPGFLRPYTARAIAGSMHADQRDKAWRPYIEHVLAVEQGVLVLGGDEEEQIAALFHDAVEDGHCTFDDLRRWGATERTISIVDAVTKRPGESNADSLARLRAAEDGAKRVKVADLLHNTRHDRVEVLRERETGLGTTVRDRERFEVRLGRYRIWLAALLSDLGLIPPVEGLK